MINVNDFVTAKGEVERPVSTDGWLAPSGVELEDGFLRYTYPAQPTRLHDRTGMLSGFLRLADAPDQDILRYARKWGRLGPAEWFNGDMVGPPSQGGFEAIIAKWSDSLGNWRYYSQKMGEILTFAGKLEEPLRHALRRKETAAGRESIRKQICEWLFCASVTPTLRWTNGRWTIRFQISSLLGALAVQLMLLVARVDGLGLCSSCGNPFPIDSRRTSYCPKCGRGAALRAAARRYYARKKTARAMWKQGRSVSDIAAFLHKPESQVQEWLRPAVEERRVTNGKETKRPG